MTRHTVHSEEGPGRVRRIAAAVVINDRPVAGSGKNSHPVWKPRSADEMKRLQQIAQAAVGFDAARGDEVVVQNISFSGNAEDAAPAGFAAVVSQGRDLLRSQPSLLRSVIIGGSLLLLGLLVLRPLGKQTVAALALPEAGARIQDAKLLMGDSAATGERTPMLNDAPANEPQRLLQQVAARIHAEPQGSARLIESWITAGGELEP